MTSADYGMNVGGTILAELVQTEDSSGVYGGAYGMTRARTGAVAAATVVKAQAKVPGGAGFATRFTTVGFQVIPVRVS